MQRLPGSGASCPITAFSTNGPQNQWVPAVTIHRMNGLVRPPLETCTLMRDYGVSSAACFPMAPPREIELKLDLPVDSLPRLTRSSLLKGAVVSRPKPVVSIYFDTDKLALRSKGLSLRVRRVNGRLVQTIKQENGAGVFDRHEWEQDVRARQPDLDAARDTALQTGMKEGMDQGFARLDAVLKTLS